ncbi:hypothetical protein NQ318_005288 [Aromia moschata]|uniref:Mos1 transposase HTH domain-containing protein n=1 Tax=Aromia moschata TaxID=1265417 RepID=A0AAV8XP27_9CUCU|nr:hypothetical protein NQ318_005288 [Aromia moschata]
MEQRVNLKFIVNLGKTFTEAYTMLKEVYGNECLSPAQVFEWFKRFKEGRKRPKTIRPSERPSTSKTDENIETIGLLKTVTLKGTRFESVETVKAKAMEVLNQPTEADSPALLSAMEKSYGAV